MYHLTTPDIVEVYADMAELVDALASGASARKGVEVQVLLSAPCNYYQYKSVPQLKPTSINVEHFWFKASYLIAKSTKLVSLTCT